MKFPKIRLPYLNFWLDVYILEIRTHVNTKSDYKMVTNWIVLEVRVFHKWGFSFELYSPEMALRNK